ncbi:MAG: hypothetical protein MR270_00490 [Erysipelotrichaceae bacterium]|nr:hypothetical protein [Erysipelotrichaceae bacterium]
MRIKHILYVSIFTLLSLIFPLTSVSVHANDTVFDFSKKDSQTTSTLDAINLIKVITNGDVTNAEQEFLQDQEYKMLYESKIPQSYITTNLHHQNLTIIADEYSYTTQNNEIITWIPYQANLSDNTLFFDKIDNRYICNFNDVQEESESVDITYIAEFTLDNQKVNQLINCAYNVAHDYVINQTIEKETQKYEQAYAQYLLDKQAYEQYLLDKEQYIIDYQKYQEYVLLKQQYDDDKVRYDAYIKEYNQYLLEKEQYDQYVEELKKYNEAREAYEKYLIDKANYEQAYETFIAKYPNYKADKIKIDYQLKAMELIDTPMTSLQRTVYDAILGNTVTSVLDRKSELVQLNVDGKVVDDAEKATKALREIFVDYFSFNNDKEKYAYYCSNYVAIRKNLELLLRSLDKLYRSGFVSQVLKNYFPAENRYEEKYLILISQLAMISMAIDAKPVKNYEMDLNPSFENAAYFSYSYIIGNSGKTILENLENVIYIEDIDENGSYVRNTYPEEPPIKPQEIIEPLRPKEVAIPIKPIEVAKPEEEPAVVNKPSEVIEVINPIEPTPYVVDETIASLIEEYNENQLVYKEEYNEDVIINLTSTFTKKYKNVDYVSVAFYDQFGQLINIYQTDKGSYITYDDILPSKQEDKQYSLYRFDYWQYEDGTRLDLNNVIYEGSVYPVFAGITLQKYEVTWIVDKKTISEIYEYGDMPIYKGDLIKPYEGNYCFVFDKWNQNITNVEEDVIYEAIFVKLPIVSNKNGEANRVYIENDIINIEYFEDENNIVIDLFLLYENIIDEESNYKLHITTVNYDIEFSSLTLKRMKNNNIIYIEPTYQKLDNGEYTFVIKLLNQEGNANLTCDIDVVLYGFKFNSTHSYLCFENEENEETKVRAEFNSNTMKAAIKANKQYNIKEKYSINIANYSSEIFDFEVSATQANVGEFISIYVAVKQEGIIFNGVNVVDIFYNEITLENGGFVMPRNDVYISLPYSVEKFIVDFIVDGIVIFSKQYQYGQTLELPTNPKKASDEEYSYTFIKWDKEIVSIVKENTQYVAVFEKIPLEKIESHEKISYIKLAKDAATSFIEILLVTIMLIRRKRRGKIRI